MSTLAESVGTCEKEAIPLSFAQRRLWFLAQMQPESPLYNIPYLLRLQGELDPALLQRSLDFIIERHTSLRTTLVAAGDEPVQIIGSACRVELPLLDLSGAAPESREAELLRLAREEACRPFDLGADLMLRARLYRIAPLDHALILVLHHASADGWSMGVLYRELSAIYRALVLGREPVLPKLPIQYADYAVWQNENLGGPPLQKILDYWKKTLAGAPPLLDLPTDRPRPTVQSYRGAVEILTLPASLMAAVRQFNRDAKVTIYMTLLAAFKALISRLADRDDIVIGSPVAGRDLQETEGLIGCFVNLLALRTDLSGNPSFRELVGRVREVTLGAYDHRSLPFEKLVEEIQPERNLNHGPVCQVAFVMQNAPTSEFDLPGIKAEVEPIYTGTAKFDLMLSACEQNGGLEVTAEFATDLFDRGTIRRLLGYYRALLAGAMAEPATTVARLPLLDADERNRILREWNATELEYSCEGGIDRLFEAQAARTPAAEALACGDRTLSYRELNERAEWLAARLRRQGVGPEVIVGICTDRSIGMMVGLLAILKAGGAYLPLDPAYPAKRLAFMLEDSKASVVIADRHLPDKLSASALCVIRLDDEGRPADKIGADSAPGPAPSAMALSVDRLAYLLYTSGSTGKPKGVMVTHRNVLNFFAGMDRVLGPEPGVWLAVTSISFDISGLELFWTLSRGYKVVILTEEAKRDPGALEGQGYSASKALDFSLFYFGDGAGSDGRGQPYRLLLEGARFADENGFEAIWTPERHFHSFGGPFPNPAVTGAAVAAITRRVKIRAGSVVMPLHHPLRVAEEWSIVDNLSQGRVGISFASGWHDRDFVFAPRSYGPRKEVMRRGIDEVRQLWRGKSLRAVDGSGTEREIKIYPTPVQPELPVWLTAAGNPDTFRLAGEIGANVLTHLLGQTPDELSRKIEIYRAARRAAGFDPGRITLALHTFLGEDLAEVRAKVRGPFSAYLLKSLDLMKGLSAELYPGLDVDKLSEEEKQVLTEHAFQRYAKTSGLLGTPDSCRPLLERLSTMGVDEIACLIDFGVDADSVLASLTSLNRLRETSRPAQAGHSMADEIIRHDVTHLQCTPSFARILLQNPRTRGALRGIRRFLVGGEAVSTGLADELRAATGSPIDSMYGPTETTIWSATARVEPGSTGVAPLGRPIANTRIYILDRHLQPAPPGVPGELYIGGDGVARGYFQRPELTAERFVTDPFRSAGRIYRTGDLARYRADGVIEFLGRTDQQVKLRGYRIELEEIESVLARHPGVRMCAAAVRTDDPENPRLTAYIVPAETGAPDVASLRQHLLRHLPEQMIPGDFVALARMPLTPNGKIDRRALPSPDAGRLKPETSFAAPQAGLEESIARIWEEVLGVKNPGADDNFFDLGGHSLLVVRAQGRLRESVGIDLSVVKLFQYPTIRSLALHLSEAKGNGDGFLNRIRERGQRQRAAVGRPTVATS